MPHFIFGGPYGTHSYNITVNPNHCRNPELDPPGLEPAMAAPIPPLLPGASPLSASLTAALYGDERLSPVFASSALVDSTTPASLATTQSPLRGQSVSRYVDTKLFENILDFSMD